MKVYDTPKITATFKHGIGRPTWIEVPIGKSISSESIILSINNINMDWIGIVGIIQMNVTTIRVYYINWYSQDLSAYLRLRILYR